MRPYLQALSKTGLLCSLLSQCRSILLPQPDTETRYKLFAFYLEDEGLLIMAGAVATTWSRRAISQNFQKRPREALLRTQH